jgi:hypothetical protein
MAAPKVGAYAVLPPTQPFHFRAAAAPVSVNDIVAAMAGVLFLLDYFSTVSTAQGVERNPRDGRRLSI